MTTRQTFRDRKKNKNGKKRNIPFMDNNTNQRERKKNQKEEPKNHHLNRNFKKEDPKRRT